MSKMVWFDTEFNDTNEKNVFPVCVSYVSNIEGVERKENLWMLDPKQRQRFIDLLYSWQSDNVTLVAFAVTAEARFLLALGVDPRGFKWVDLWIEYRMLLNHNHKLECGKQLIKGKVVNVRPIKPKWDQEEGYSTGGKAETSLAACSYKILGVNRDTDHKDAMRDLILSKKEFNEFEAMDIMDYCMEDVVYLPELHKKLFNMLYEIYHPEDRKSIAQEIYLRADYAVATALMESKGYSIDYDATMNFSNSVKDIIFQMQGEVNAEFPSVGAFLPSVKGDKYTQKKKKIQAWVKAQNIEDWMQTDKGDISLSLDAFEEHYSHKDSQKIFGNRFVKFLRDRQSLNGFTANTTKKTLWSSVGRDKRVRPYFGIFRAQSGRSQPSATGYMLLKSSWMRVMLQPPKGKAMIAIDYGQQEFLLAGLLSQDQNMLDAYMSGDPYLYTAKLAKAVPQDATKESHSFMRDKFKSTVLGIQFGMREVGLAKKLTTDTEKFHSEEEALELIELFEEAYPDYIDYKQQVWEDYKNDGYLKLRCGWTMMGDNHNQRSVNNCPVQGHGASIMRKAAIMAQTAGLDITMTLHDALYAECDTDQVSKSLDILAYCMSEAFKHYFRGTPVEEYANCRLDPAIWGSDFNGEMLYSPTFGEVKATHKYIDKRRFDDYKRYRTYFEPKEDLELIASM